MLLMVFLFLHVFCFLLFTFIPVFIIHVLESVTCCDKFKLNRIRYYYFWMIFLHFYTLLYVELYVIFSK